jgi:hypothetical protein
MPLEVNHIPHITDDVPPTAMRKKAQIMFRRYKSNNTDVAITTSISLPMLIMLAELVVC